MLVAPTGQLKELQDTVGSSIVDPIISAQGWQFTERSVGILNPVNNVEYLRESYTLADENNKGRVTEYPEGLGPLLSKSELIVERSQIERNCIILPYSLSFDRFQSGFDRGHGDK